MLNLNFILCELKKDFDLKILKKNTKIILVEDSISKGIFNFKCNEYEIHYKEENEIVRFLLESNNFSFDKNFEIVRNRKINKLSLMIDMARNNVMKVDAIKKVIRYMSITGYTTLRIYLEDVFEVIDEPYFGYLRGRYSKNELMEVIDYAEKFKIKVIPCVQTLAHLNCLKFFTTYRWNFDIDDILLVDSEVTNRLLNNIFKTLKDVFRTNVVNIGMDEAFHLGRGKYLDLHGYEDRFSIFNRHLNNVLKIAKSYGFKCEMWSDMFFESTEYAYETSKNNVLKNIEPDLTLIYWDYNSHEENKFDGNIKIHKKITNNIACAGGAWKWLGFAPNNTYALKNVENFMNASFKNNLNEFILTCWGDNGGETPIWSVLPTIVFASNYNYIEYKDFDYLLFKTLTGKSFNSFMKLDLIAKTRKVFDTKDLNSLNRIFLYNDLLIGPYDSLVKNNQFKIYKKVSRDLKKEVDDTKFAYLFDTLSKLADVLSIKVNLGIEMRDAYKKDDREGLKKCIIKLKKLDKKIDAFYEAFYYQWHIESKGNGFDVQDLRIGGIKQRIKACIRLISDYLLGKIEKIDELEENILDFYGNVDVFYKPNDIVDPRYKHMCSINVND